MRRLHDSDDIQGYADVLRGFLQEWLCSVSLLGSTYDTGRYSNVCMEGYRRYTSQGLFMALI